MRHTWALLMAAGCGSSMTESERAAIAALKTIASSNADFRGNDRDNNMIQDFWTGDVAGLYYLVPVGSGASIQLIEREIADADPSRPGAQPYRGYWFVAMETDESGAPYAYDTSGVGTEGQTNRHHYKFGFCAYPVEYGYTGRYCFYINEGNAVTKADTQGVPNLKWQADDAPRGGRPSR